jgi:hypothetical protein
VWFERSFPELAQRFVSALQLQATADLRDPVARRSAVARRRCCARRPRPCSACRCGRMLDPRPTARAPRRRRRRRRPPDRRRSAAAGDSAGLRAASPRRRRRLPRATRLTVELPPAGADLQRDDRDGETTITLPAGADLHVSVLAEGAVPKDCFLDVQALRADGAGVDTRSVAMTRGPATASVTCSAAPPAASASAPAAATTTAVTASSWCAPCCRRRSRPGRGRP